MRDRTRKTGVSVTRKMGSTTIQKRKPKKKYARRKGRTWLALPHSSTVRVAVLVNRFFLYAVDESGSRFPPVVPFSLLSLIVLD